VHAPDLGADSTDPTTWGECDRALRAYEDGKADGIGFALGDGWAGVDLDDCRDEAGTVATWAQRIITRLDSYAEISPSGRGVKVFCRGKLPKGRRRKGNIEMYDAGRYFTVTGRHLDGTPSSIRDRADQLARLHAEIFTADVEPSRRREDLPLDLSDADLIERAQAASNGTKFSQLWAGSTAGYDSHSEADQALANLLAFWTSADAGRMDRLFRASGLMRPKWDERRGTSTYGATTIETALKSCRETYSGTDWRGNGKPPETVRRLTESAAVADGVTLADFWAYMPMHNYIFAPTGETWPASSVNARVAPVDGETASKWLDRERAVEQMTWYPGEPEIIENRLISGGGWIDREGCRTFNLYRPPNIEPGDPSKAGPWLEHIEATMPESAPHIIRWFAHRVQRPHEKVNHALVLIGAQGTGKDTIVAGVIPAVGPWNVSEVGPDQLMGRFNAFVRSVILRVSEARDLGDHDRYRLYDHLKTYTAAPPDVLRVDEKNIREYVVPNVCGVIITSNHIDGIYLPADDRRHYVAGTEATKDSFSGQYWNELYSWYENGGHGHVAAYLHSLDLSEFNPKAPPPKTAAFWRVVDAGRAPEDAELADALETLQDPAAITVAQIADCAESMFADWLRDRKNGRQIPHRLETAGYVPVRNDGTRDGRWKVDGRNTAIYARRDLPIRERIRAARQLVEAAR
jgi:hypothetical protein